MNKPDNPLGIRVLSLPKCRMVTSGMDTGKPFEEGGKLRKFDSWFSKIDASSHWMPRDFLWYDPQQRGMEWWFVWEAGMDTADFDVIDFEGGLYAAAISWDEDDADGERVYQGVKQWIADSGSLELDERPGHWGMFHVVTPPEVKAALGHNQLDIFVPVKIRQT